MTILEVAARLGRVLSKTHIEPEITNRYRVGDIRHCVGDISLARETIGYEPRISLDDGLSELATWVAGQRPTDRADEARRELEVRGLAV